MILGNTFAPVLFVEEVPSPHDVEARKPFQSEGGELFRHLMPTPLRASYALAFLVRASEAKASKSTTADHAPTLNSYMQQRRKLIVCLGSAPFKWIMMKGGKAPAVAMFRSRALPIPGNTARITMLNHYDVLTQVLSENTMERIRKEFGAQLQFITSQIT